MKVVVAMDSFKGSLTSLEVGQGVAEGVQRAIPDAAVCVRPLADGGEGTVEALVHGMGGRMEQVQVTGPLGKPVACLYGIIDRSQTAIVEMSGAAGITLLSKEQRNPLHTTTYGVGEVIKDAITKGCRRFLVGIGGSATNDGGIGMLQALGFGLLDAKGEPVPFGAKGLQQLAKITTDNCLPQLADCQFTVACDVTNPLCGAQGCSAVFGPQKGANPSQIDQMDAWLKDYAKLAAAQFGADYANEPGAGAAGGMGFAFMTFLQAKLESGISIVLKETNLEEYIKEADIVVTGEGRLDGQTVMGKAPIGVAKLAKQYGKTVLAFSGCVTEDARACNEAGIDAYFPILRSVVSLSEAMSHDVAQANLIATVEQVFRVVNLSSKKG